jgi:hypothetical protein
MDIRRAALLIEHEFCVCGLATDGSDQENASDMGLKRHSSAGSLSAHRGYRSLVLQPGLFEKANDINALRKKTESW